LIESTKAIVLSALKFKDTSLIVKCYTQKGIKSYLVKGVLSKNTKSKKIKPAYFQTFTLLDLIANHNDKGQLNYINELRVYQPLHNIYTDIYKNTITSFLAEILSNILKEETENDLLFQYIENAIIWLDTHDKTNNFHIIFLLQLTKHLGFHPNTPKENDSFFNLQEGNFSFHKPIANFISGEDFNLFKSVIGTNFEAFSKVKLNARSRQVLIDILIQYFALHLPEFRKPKSLAILKTIFR
jgi:DNA repair protein RecO (recombination protein O)